MKMNSKLPFSLVGDLETLEVFESEFRPEVPESFIQIGSLNGATELVLLHQQQNTVHVFHVSDIADKKWLKHKLDNKICDLSTLIHNVRPQTVSCLIDPNDASKFDLLEIRNGNEVRTIKGVTRYTDQETAWIEYKNFIEITLTKGFQLLYAPRALKVALAK